VLAGRIFQQSIYAYRDGAEDIARSSFQRAYELADTFEVQERAFYKQLVRWVDPMYLEQGLKQVRRWRDKLSPQR